MVRSNIEIANQLRNQARLLSRRHESLYRIRAYRRAAEVVWLLPRPVEELIRRGGRQALEAVPGIGRHLAVSIAHYSATGEWKTFEELHAPRRRARP
jgi:DNA polymerase/3'-5' exonuclease PolX